MIWEFILRNVSFFGSAAKSEAWNTNRKNRERSHCSVHSVSLFSPFGPTVRSILSHCSVHSVSLFGPFGHSPFGQLVRSIRSHCSVHSVSLFGPFGHSPFGQLVRSIRSHCSVHSVPVFRPFGQSVRSIRSVCSVHSVPLFGPFGPFGQFSVHSVPLFGPFGLFVLFMMQGDHSFEAGSGRFEKQLLKSKLSDTICKQCAIQILKHPLVKFEIPLSSTSSSFLRSSAILMLNAPTAGRDLKLCFHFFQLIHRFLVPIPSSHLHSAFRLANRKLLAEWKCGASSGKKNPNTHAQTQTSSNWSIGFGCQFPAVTFIPPSGLLTESSWLNENVALRMETKSHNTAQQVGSAKSAAAWMFNPWRTNSGQCDNYLTTDTTTDLASLWPYQIFHSHTPKGISFFQCMW